MLKSKKNDDTKPELHQFNAFKNVFPGIKCRGCLFHMNQSFLQVKHHLKVYQCIQFLKTNNNFVLLI